MAPWPEPVEEVAAYLREAGAEARIEQMTVGVATAQAAADAVGCALGQIVKTVVFLCGGDPVAVLAPGDRRVDPHAVARLVGATGAAVASAAEVRAATGFEPGAVAPFPLPRVQEVLFERTLLRYPAVWAGAGSSRHLVRSTPTELLRLARGRVEDLVLPSA